MLKSKFAGDYRDSFNQPLRLMIIGAVRTALQTRGFTVDVRHHTLEFRRIPAHADATEARALGDRVRKVHGLRPRWSTLKARLCKEALALRAR